MSTEVSNGIAIIGMACRFPGAENIGQYWKNIREGKECMETLSPEDSVKAGMDRNTVDNPNFVNRFSGIKDIDKFDADFFKINPKEATFMDPQQRLLMEKAWEAVEDAGYNADDIGGKVAVFASTGASSYFLQSMVNNPNFIEEAGGMKAVLHSLDKDHIATKIAYRMNLTGPAVTVQSACSSSMVGTVMACQSLLTYQSDAALVGGVMINVPQKVGYMYEKGNVMSKDGYCRPFDNDADGTVFGSGVGCIVLKRLEDAIEDNDRIYAVIRGSAVGNDGNDKVGYTAPGVRGQMEVISDALEFAEIDPATISYVEAHGTGTIMGDPIEVEAISKVYEEYTDKTQYCALGSVKANIGHLNSASGIAGIIKSALMVYNKEIPPLTNFKKENEKIDFKHSPFYINTELKKYESDIPFRAAVSSFGIGGTNGHVIMEEFKADEAKRANRSCYLIPVSARDEQDLRSSCENLAEYLSEHRETDIADIEKTLQCGRKAFEKRIAFVVKDTDELIKKLRGFLDNGSTGDISGSADEHIEQIVSHWENGYEIGWKEEFDTKTAKTVSLPTYPFKRNSYWSYSINKEDKVEEKESPEKKIKQFKVELHERPNLGNEYVAPEGEVQERLSDIWSELLGIKNIGATDDFFELGGHSLMATSLISSVKNEFMVELEIFELFDCPTIESLAELITDKLTELIESMNEDEVEAYLNMEKNYGT